MELILEGLGLFAVAVVDVGGGGTDGARPQGGRHVAGGDHHGGLLVVFAGRGRLQWLGARGMDQGGEIGTVQLGGDLTGAMGHVTAAPRASAQARGEQLLEQLPHFLGESVFPRHHLAGPTCEDVVDHVGGVAGQELAPQGEACGDEAEGVEVGAQVFALVFDALGGAVGECGARVVVDLFVQPGEHLHGRHAVAEQQHAPVGGDRDAVGGEGTVAVQPCGLGP